MDSRIRVGKYALYEFGVTKETQGSYMVLKRTELQKRVI